MRPVKADLASLMPPGRGERAGQKQSGLETKVRGGADEFAVLIGAWIGSNARADQTGQDQLELILRGPASELWSNRIMSPARVG